MDRRRPNRVPLLVGGEALGLKLDRFEGKLPALLPPAGDGGTSRPGKPWGIGLPKLLLLRPGEAVVVIGPDAGSPSGSLSSRSRSSFQGFIALEGRTFPRQPRYIGVCAEVCEQVSLKWVSRLPQVCGRLYEPLYESRFSSFFCGGIMWCLTVV